MYRWLLTYSWAMPYKKAPLFVKNRGEAVQG
jgi:hypothetical protein